MVWPAPGLVVQHFKLIVLQRNSTHWAEVAECRVAALGIVRVLCSRACQPWLRHACDRFCAWLRSASSDEKKLSIARRYRDVAGSAHAADDAMIDQQTLKLLAVYRAALVGMMSKVSVCRDARSP